MAGGGAVALAIALGAKVRSAFQYSARDGRRIAWDRHRRFVDPESIDPDFPPGNCRRVCEWVTPTSRHSARRLQGATGTLILVGPECSQGLANNKGQHALPYTARTGTGAGLRNRNGTRGADFPDSWYIEPNKPGDFRKMFGIGLELSKPVAADPDTASGDKPDMPKPGSGKPGE
jgi:hypothetical protein